MPLGRGARTGLGIVGGAGLLLAAGLAVVMAPSGPDDGTTTAGAKDAATGPGASTAAPTGGAERSGGLAAGNAAALAEVEARIVPARPDDGTEPSAPPAMTDAQLDAWLADLAGLGAGFARFGPADRARVVAVVGSALGRLAEEPAPSRWIEVLAPSAEVLTVALADASPVVRAGAVDVLGRCWAWQPGVATWPDADRAVASWKNRLHTPLVTLLDDPEPGVRLASVLAMGTLPIDAMAAPAVARLKDDVPAVRIQVLNSFAPRRDLLTDEEILPLLYDPEGVVVLAAQLVLRARGLTEDQIGLAQMLYHPRADLRASAIPLVEAREDIDPIVWLLRLSRDDDETVRSKALEALGRLASPDARRRVAEMAASDPSEAIRDAARKTLDGLTAALPPLPEDSGLSIRAN